jgi:hypothetical protein
MRENADGSVFPSAIAPPPNGFSRAIAYVIVRIYMLGRQICTITDGKTEVAVAMMVAQSRMEKWIRLRFCALRTSVRCPFRDAQKRKWTRFAIRDCA